MAAGSFTMPQIAALEPLFVSDGDGMAPQLIPRAHRDLIGIRWWSAETPEIQTVYWSTDRDMLVDLCIVENRVCGYHIPARNVSLLIAWTMDKDDILHARLIEGDKVHACTFNNVWDAPRHTLCAHETMLVDDAYVIAARKPLRDAAHTMALSTRQAVAFDEATLQSNMVVWVKQDTRVLFMVRTFVPTPARALVARMHATWRKESRFGLCIGNGRFVPLPNMLYIKHTQTRVQFDKRGILVHVMRPGAIQLLIWRLARMARVTCRVEPHLPMLFVMEPGDMLVLRAAKRCVRIVCMAE